MTDAPERIWAVSEPDDESAQILGEVYAQQLPDGMVGDPVEYIRADLVDAMLKAEREKALRDAAVEIECNWGHIATPEMRNAILALISDDANIAAAKEYIRAELARPRVKELVWSKRGDWDVWDCCFPNPDYTIYKIEFCKADGKYYLDDTIGGPVGDYCYSILEEAKAAAQADFERRIMECLL